MREIECGVLVIGAGPGGYACAIRAGRLGLDTVIVEEGPTGGTCLNVGCIPSKALIHAADEFARIKEFGEGHPLGISAAGAAIDLGRTVDWKDGIVKRLGGGVAGLLKKAGAKAVKGRALVEDGKTVRVEGPEGPLRVRAENLVIATGSAPVELPALPFGGRVMSSTEALDLRAPPARLIVVGGGYIGLEIGTAFAKLGSAVTVVEAEARILPQYDADLTRPVAARLKELGVEVRAGAKALGMTPDGTALRIEGADGGEEALAADAVLVAVGRRPSLAGFGLEDLGLGMAGPYLRVDDVCRTTMRGVFAIGDVTGEPMLAHRAMAQGTLAAEHLAGLPARWDKRAIAAICFTDPEVVTAGLSPAEAPGAKVSTFPFQANGRALTLGRGDGFVRVVSDPGSGLVLGMQAVGAGVSELAGEFGLALEMAATLTDVADTIHAHPTLGETVQEAALLGLGRALHI